jgi:dihydrodipicolinate synthase/N-acetylneuraminate lyase
MRLRSIVVVVKAESAGGTPPDRPNAQIANFLETDFPRQRLSNYVHSATMDPHLPETRFAQPMNDIESIEPISMLKPRRKIVGMSAILLPMASPDAIDWDGFDAHVARTYDAGLTPAINMDTGYGHLLNDSTRLETLERTRSIGGGRDYVAGAFVGDSPGDDFNPDAYRAGMDQIQSSGGTPILFQSYGLAHGSDEQIVENYQSLSTSCDSFYAFELGTVFAPFGNIYSLNVYEQLMGIDNCLGAKHSSLSRDLEWQRLILRDQKRPDFKVLTGNDLAIDMVMYGSDYLLGLSTFAPDAFAARDAMWESGDPGFYELNDLLQYLGAFGFRPHVPAYKHDAAMFLKLRNQIKTDLTFPGSPERPESDRETLLPILNDIEKKLGNPTHSPLVA